jgi:hypothetical protein
MNVLAVLMVGGPLMAMAGPSAAADHPMPLPIHQPLIQLADNDDFATRKDEYLRRTRNDMEEWRKKIDAAGERTEAQGHEASAETRAHLNRTWSATEGGWRKLQAESAEGWDKTRNAYEHSTAELRVQWHKLHPEDKD